MECLRRPPLAGTSNSIISLLSQSKFTGKLRHRETKDSYKIDERSNPRSHQVTRPHKRDRGSIPPPEPSVPGPHTLWKLVLSSPMKNEKTEPGESQRPAYCHTAKKKQRLGSEPRSACTAFQRPLFCVESGKEGRWPRVRPVVGRCWRNPEPAPGRF